MGAVRSLSLIPVLLFSVLAFGGENQPLDHAYPKLVHPEPIDQILEGHLPPLPARNNVVKLIENQTPVKSQKNRGTCSIFSSTALLESILIKQGRAGRDIDLSEEWLQYLTTLRSSEEGSTSPQNFKLLRLYGQPSEKAMPYNGETWTNKSSGLALKRCGHLPRGRALKSCLVSHRDPGLITKSDEDLLNPVSVLYDPEFVNARSEALDNRFFFFGQGEGDDGIVRRVRDIKASLAAGIPLTLDLNFFDGAWNYPGSAKRGIYRSARLWEQGIVTHPEVGSMDRLISSKAEDGHSVVVVGYDDDREVEYWMNMEDGHRQKFKRKGVYYIKNSWGASTWGKEFQIDGVPYPGYGMILQVHAHAHGQFYKLDLPATQVH